ncbi:hypothetical protein OU5_P0188 (plasmid) [Pseudomonas mandelii JR-1]|uniref:Uncharacterized protein n=1 Tax=Pseudomonas mandelii JR-1 TaxID=1147786 RepID=A0A024ELG8_9PSED|nr:hypothetical protein OU5_P0188 [Pseudomonas mandelii JR-1]
MLRYWRLDSSHETLPAALPRFPAQSGASPQRDGGHSAAGRPMPDENCGYGKDGAELLSRYEQLFQSWQALQNRPGMQDRQRAASVDRENPRHTVGPPCRFLLPRLPSRPSTFRGMATAPRLIPASN